MRCASLFLVGRSQQSGVSGRQQSGHRPSAFQWMLTNRAAWVQTQRFATRQESDSCSRRQRDHATYMQRLKTARSKGKKRAVFVKIAVFSGVDKAPPIRRMCHSLIVSAPIGPSGEVLY